MVVTGFRGSLASALAAKREELTIAARALDRVLRAGRYWVPMWYKDKALIAHWSVFGKPEKTAMFDIDTGMSALIQQTKPNDGVLATIGALGATLEGPIGFDVATTAEGVNTAWLAANGGLHTVDLDSGKITASWPLQGADAPLRDLTILPAM